jgi:uncharacterized OB-fold protein
LIAPGLVREDDDGPKLVGASCSRCDRRSFPFAETCPWCGADSPREVVLSPTGTLWAWTAVTAAPPGYQGSVPFGFGVVELDDGVRVITRLTESDPSALEFGHPMRLVLDVVDEDEGQTVDVLTWAFTAVATA